MVIAIIQARTGSTRLPNKVFSDLSGEPLIHHVVDRLHYTKHIDRVVLATTTNPKDDVLASWADDNRIALFRGDENDVLSRYYHSASAFNASVIVRITADDPFKDPHIIDDVICLLREKNLDFAYNNNPPSFPEGLDTEVFTMYALTQAFRCSNDPFEREHVTQYLYRNPELFRQQNLAHTRDVSHLRWTIDTPADLAMAQEVYKALYHPGQLFAFDEIMGLLERRPEIGLINQDVQRSNMYIKKGI